VIFSTLFLLFRLLFQFFNLFFILFFLLGKLYLLFLLFLLFYLCRLLQGKLNSQLKLILFITHLIFKDIVYYLLFLFDLFQ